MFPSGDVLFSRPFLAFPFSPVTICRVNSPLAQMFVLFPEKGNTTWLLNFKRILKLYRGLRWLLKKSPAICWILWQSVAQLPLISLPTVVSSRKRCHEFLKWNNTMKWMDSDLHVCEAGPNNAYYSHDFIIILYTLMQLSIDRNYRLGYSNCSHHFSQSKALFIQHYSHLTPS